MMRSLFLTGLSAASVFGAGLVAQAGGAPHHRPLLPPEVAYRDPAYLPPPPPPVPVVTPPRSLSLPLYNEPPPRF